MQSLLYAGSLGAPLLLLWLWGFLKTVTSRTRSIPGPRLARFTRLWYFKKVWDGAWHQDNMALHQEHGPLVRVAPGWFSLSAPDKEVYGIASRFPKSDWYQGWKHPDPARWTLFPDQDMRRHAETRRRFQALYSLSALLSYEPYVDGGTDLFLARMAACARAGEVVDLARWFQCFAFDVLGDMTYSRRFGFLDRGEDVAGTMRALERSMPYSTLVGIYAWLHPYLYPLLEKIPGSGAAGRTYLMGFVGQRIAARKEERARLARTDTKKTPATADRDGSAPRDFLDKLMDAHDEDPEKVTPHHIFMMGLSNIIAGSDTTSISLSAILWYLITTPESMKKLREEVDLQPRTQGSKIAFKTANTSMPYLQAVIKEALRLQPAVGLPLWRVVPQGGATISGQYFEAGSVVGINAWVAHYDTSVWGDDAGVFRPERWIEAGEGNPERLREMEAHYMPVSATRSHLTCINSCTDRTYGVDANRLGRSSGWGPGPALAATFRRWRCVNSSPSLWPGMTSSWLCLAPSGSRGTTGLSSRRSSWLNCHLGHEFIGPQCHVCITMLLYAEISRSDRFARSIATPFLGSAYLKPFPWPTSSLDEPARAGARPRTVSGCMPIPRASRGSPQSPICSSKNWSRSRPRRSASSGTRRCRPGTCSRRSSSAHDARKE